MIACGGGVRNPVLMRAIATRLPHLLRRAGADAVAEKVDPVLISAVLPRVAEAAYRARYQDSRGISDGEAAIAPATLDRERV